jgi:transcriptional regulator with XRE-family HTH domain
LGIELGRQLAELRKAKELTQVQFAEVSGVSSTYIARIEKGHHSPSVEMLQRLLVPLGAKLTIISE